MLRYTQTMMDCYGVKLQIQGDLKIKTDRYDGKLQIKEDLKIIIYE